MGRLGAQILVQQNGSNCIANASQLFLSAAEKLVNVLGRAVVRRAQKPWRNVRVDGTTRFFGRALRQGRHDNAGWQLRASIAAAFLIWGRWLTLQPQQRNTTAARRPWLVAYSSLLKTGS